MTQEYLYAQLCSYENLELAYEKARKRKTFKRYVILFEENLKENLLQLRHELLSKTYRPQPLKTFILRDPKTRKISRSEFRDRVVHHAICNIIEPIFEKCFIYDSYANRAGKGTHQAIQRFDSFKRKVSKNNTKKAYVLKADIKQYFESVPHRTLLKILQKRIKDPDLLWLMSVILANNHSKEGLGMPLGNLTSQFLANVYLNELDQYVKHELRVKHYIRYVDDFAILDTSQEKLIELKGKINLFLKTKLALELHPEKSRIIPLQQGVHFLGVRIFPHLKLILKKNVRKFEKRFYRHASEYQDGGIPREYAVKSFQGWLAYIVHANTYKYRRHLVREFNRLFPLEPILELTSLKKHESFQRKVEESSFAFTTQKTLALFRQGYSTKQIAEIRALKEGTIWQHFAELIEYGQIPVWKVIPWKNIKKIRPLIWSEKDTLTVIKQRLQDANITYPEIACVLANVKNIHKPKRVNIHFAWYQKVHCYRKCYFEKKQRRICKTKMDAFYCFNPRLEVARDEFLLLFNISINICILPQREKVRFISWSFFQKRIRNILGPKEYVANRI